MARPTWSGVIGFGMVSIPVKLYAATESKRISFNQIHNVCKTKIKEIRWCEACDRQVEWSEIDKGFQYEKGEYVTLDENDFDQLPLPSKNTVEVSKFVPEDQLDPIYYEKSYFVEVDASAHRPFSLLIEALRHKSMIGIGNITMRTRERLCAIRPAAGGLLISTLYYCDELRIDPAEEFDKATVNKKELDMASNLIDLMTSDFQPADYEDHYRQALMEVIEAKIAGQPIKVASSKGKRGKVIDLLDALQRSVSEVKGSTKAKSAKSTRTKKTAAKAKRTTARKKTSRGAA